MTKEMYECSQESVILSSSQRHHHGSLDNLLSRDGCEECRSQGRSDESCETVSTILSYEDLSEEHSETCDINDVFEQHQSIRRVRFSTVEVREYNLTIGDHPSPDSYPLSLDWDHTVSASIPVDQYVTRSCNRLNSMARKIRIALVSGQSLQDLTVLESTRVCDCDIADRDMLGWCNSGDQHDQPTILPTPIKPSATMSVLNASCDSLDTSMHSTRSGRLGVFVDDESWLDFDDDDEFFEGF